ncbi:hypothetical protein Q8A73_018605 [Channa argus]|nr:hypothetical protein Q8A73_018605 [Channa argus]
MPPAPDFVDMNHPFKHDSYKSLQSVSMGGCSTDVASLHNWASSVIKEDVGRECDSVILCGPLWEVKRDKGESSEEKVNGLGKTEEEKEKLKERSVKNEKKEGGVECAGAQAQHMMRPGPPHRLARAREQQAGQCDQTLIQVVPGEQEVSGRMRALHITEEAVMKLQMQSGSGETHWGSYCGELGNNSDFHRSLLSLPVWLEWSEQSTAAVAVADSSVGTLWGGVSHAGFLLLSL